jgi:MFS family permease
MSQLLTLTQNQIARRYLAYSFLTHLYFICAIWVHFYRLFITDQQTGLVDGVAFAIGLIAEVPSGVLADRFGRDRLVKIGQLLQGGGILIQAFGGSFIALLVGQSVFMVGMSFVSGADEALFFSKLKFEQNSVSWRKLLTRRSQVSLLALLFSISLGGWLYTVNPRAPWILTGLSLFSSILLIRNIRDEREVKARKAFTSELVQQIQSIKSGFLEFVSPKFLLYVPIIVAVQGIFYACGWGMLRIVLLDRFYFDPFTGSLVIASCSILTVGMLSLMYRLAERMGEKQVIACISLATAFCLLISVASIGAWGYFVILALYCGEHVLYTFMSEVVNNRASEEQRATLLSVASFLRTMPYVVLAPIIGYLNSHNQLEYFLVFWGGVIILALLQYLRLKRGQPSVQGHHLQPRTESPL